MLDKHRDRVATARTAIRHLFRTLADGMIIFAASCPISDHHKHPGLRIQRLLRPTILVSQPAQLLPTADVDRWNARCSLGLPRTAWSYFTAYSIVSTSSPLRFPYFWERGGPHLGPKVRKWPRLPGAISERKSLEALPLPTRQKSHPKKGQKHRGWLGNCLESNLTNPKTITASSCSRLVKERRGRLDLNVAGTNRIKAKALPRERILKGYERWI